MLSPKRLEGLYRIVDISRNLLIVLIFSFVVIAGGTDVFLRYATAHGSLKWTDEILRYLNIWLVFLGAAVGVKRGTHMQVEFFLRKFFTAQAIRWIKKMTLVITLLCLALLIVAGSQKVLNYRNVQIQATTMSISWFYLAIPVGCLLMAVDYLLILLYGEHPFSRTREEKA
jgi:C4-dicarboxylate transporter DctQ subunit